MNDSAREHEAMERFFEQHFRAIADFVEKMAREGVDAELPEALRND